ALRELLLRPEDFVKVRDSQRLAAGQIEESVAPAGFNIAEVIDEALLVRGVRLLPDLFSRGPPRGHYPWLFLHLPGHRFRLLLVAQPEIHRMAKNPVGCPLGESHLSDESGLNPVRPFVGR